MNENPNRYSIAVLGLDGKGKKVKMTTLHIYINKPENLKIRKFIKFCQKCVKAKIEKPNSPVIYQFYWDSLYLHLFYRLTIFFIS